MQQITAVALAEWLADRTRPTPVLLDVREDWEFRLCHIPGSVHIPMHEIPTRLNDIEDDMETVVICHHGMRSMQVALFLQRAGFNHVINLQGGVDAWAREVDPNMATY
ncbi:rhodanese-related sulfurtransferase [Chitinivorax tropicus]|uniref:Rhodanese-related sulfurtransferase n=1 Tax=Chitinivorax tropicus TaxID=714531 RepID=A0A840MSX0_9PROT|nr:rhodanese-like domain-containing protein [Chitinivorax tropicus]MBB5019373.1 rhodanese-related sulfurtransferase [Chitinivorax tropicus]